MQRAHPKTNMTMEKTTIWRCMSFEIWWFSIAMFVFLGSILPLNKHIGPSCRWKSFNRLGMSSRPRFANNKFDGAAVWRLTRVSCGKLDVNVDILKKNRWDLIGKKKVQLFIGGSNTNIIWHLIFLMVWFFSMSTGFKSSLQAINSPFGAGCFFSKKGSSTSSLFKGDHGGWIHNNFFIY